MNFLSERRSVLPAILAVSGAFALTALTPWGMGLTHDSVMYLSAAKNLLAGRGLLTPSQSGALVPLKEWPPLYPLVLAFIGLFKVDLMSGARVLNAFLFGATIFLTASWVGRFNERSFVWPLCAAFFILVSPDMWQIYSMVWSETLFFFFFLTTALFWARYAETPTFRSLVFLALSAGLSFLCRYAGIALIAAVGLAILVTIRRSLSGRSAHALFFVVAGLFPHGCWAIRNCLLFGRPIGLDIRFHPSILAYLKKLPFTVSSWIVPGEAAGWGWGLVLVLSVGWLITRYLFSARRTARQDALLFLPAAFIALYFALLLVDSLFIAVYSPYDNRLLSPVYLCVLLILFSLAGYLPSALDRPKGRAVLLLLGACVVFGYLRSDAELWHLTRREGLGYASRDWKDSGLAAKVRALPAGTRIYTNIPEGTYFLTGRLAKGIPYQFHPATDLINDRYPWEMEAMAADLKSGEAVLAFFSRVRSRFFMPSEDELLRSLPSLRAVDQAADGVIYA